MKKNYKYPLVTIIIPCFNEQFTIGKVIKKILQTKYISKQLIVVDDGSSDSSPDIIKKFSSKIDIFIKHRNNRGKGACIKSAQKRIKGDIVLIQDADLEYNPKDYKNLIQPIVYKKYKVVYGSRVLNKNKFQNLISFSHWTRIVANHFLTVVNNIVNNQKLTDAHTCYKVFDSKLFKRIKLIENGFSFCPEVTTKISNLGYKILEVPISYNGRSYSQGKKIKFRDGIDAIITLFKYKFS